jgi:hypothetical protein
MTKTFTTVELHLFANLGAPVKMPSGIAGDGPFVWNFEFGSLGFV